MREESEDNKVEEKKNPSNKKLFIKLDSIFTNSTFSQTELTSTTHKNNAKGDMILFTKVILLFKQRISLIFQKFIKFM